LRFPFPGCLLHWIGESPSVGATDPVAGKRLEVVVCASGRQLRMAREGNGRAFYTGIGGGASAAIAYDSSRHT